VEFTEYSTRYHQDREPVLKEITTSVKGGEKVVTFWIIIIIILVIVIITPLTSTWPHLRCDVGLEEGEYK